jgi:hypothetical protein
MSGVFASPERPEPRSATLHLTSHTSVLCSRVSSGAQLWTEFLNYHLGHRCPMTFPNFYDAAPRLTVYDPLSEFLGAADQGRIEYGYADAVRLAGHSCPTVAGAYMMAVKALRHLYGSDLPVRGDIEVHVRAAAEDGTAGVMASIATLVTGATRETGFKGIAGQFDRRHLLVFGADLGGEMAFRRRDTGAGVQARVDSSLVAPDPETRSLLQRQLTSGVTDEEATRLRTLWQDRVRRLLIDHFDDPRVVQLTDWH